MNKKDGIKRIKKETLNELNEIFNNFNIESIDNIKKRITSCMFKGFKKLDNYHRLFIRKRYELVSVDHNNTISYLNKNFGVKKFMIPMDSKKFYSPNEIKGYINDYFHKDYNGNLRIVEGDKFTIERVNKFNIFLHNNYNQYNNIDFHNVTNIKKDDNVDNNHNNIHINHDENINNNNINHDKPTTAKKLYLFRSSDKTVIKLIYDFLEKHKNKVFLKCKIKRDNNNNDSVYTILCEFNIRVLILDRLAYQNIMNFTSNNKFCYYKLFNDCGDDININEL